MVAYCVPSQFQILRKKGTEPAGSGLYNKHKDKGEYACAGCGTVRRLSLCVRLLAQYGHDVC